MRFFCYCQKGNKNLVLPIGHELASLPMVNCYKYNAYNVIKKYAPLNNDKNEYGKHWFVMHKIRKTPTLNKIYQY